MKKLIILLFSFSQLAFSNSNNFSDPKLRIQYWIENYSQITEGLEYEMAHTVFNRILRVADKPIDITPRLYIFSDLKFNQVFATVDGSIILPVL